MVQNKEKHRKKYFSLVFFRKESPKFVFFAKALAFIENLW